MSNLLHVVRSRSETLNKKGVTPIMLEFQVDPVTAPYLVSSSHGVLWINQPHPGDVPHVKAAVQKNKVPGEVFWNVATAIFEKSRECQWGNAQPYTEQGLMAAIEHVSSYGLGTVDILVAMDNKDDRPKWLLDRDLGENLHGCAWVPENCAVVVPSDRQFLGMYVHLSAPLTAMVVHNPSRGFAMCWGE